MRYEEMLPHQIEEAKSRTPIAYVPWGTLEWHGAQNAIGLDSIKAHHQCLELCKVTGGVVLPPIYCGTQTMKPHLRFGHTIECRKSTVKALVRDYLEQLYDEGFLVIIIVMGHYGREHVAAIRETCDEFQRNHTLVKVWSFPDHEPVREKGFGGDHAGINETSLLMHFRPDLVDLTRLPDRETSVHKDGISSDPRKGGSKEHGETLVNALVEVAAPKIQQLLEEMRDVLKKTEGRTG